MKRIAALLAFLLAAAPCSADMTALSLGSLRTSASATGVLTTSTNSCPPGSLIIVAGSYSTVTNTLTSVADSAGNTYQTPLDNTNTTSIGQGIAYAKNTTTNLPVGGTITATFGGITNNAVSAACVTNADPVSPLDTSNHTATGLAQTAATTVNSGTLGNATAIVVGSVSFSAASGAPTNCNGSYTKLLSLTGVAPSQTVCTLIVSSNASNAFTPTWTNSVNYVSDILSFQGVSVKSAAMTLTGVGP